MSYEVTAPLVIIPNVDGKSGDWYGYVGSPVPTGLNDARCEVLAAEGMLKEVETKVETEPAPKATGRKASA